MRRQDRHPRLVTAEALSRLTSIPPRTLYRLAETGQLPCVRFGQRIVRFDLDEIMRLIDGERENPARDLKARSE